MGYGRRESEMSQSTAEGGMMKFVIIWLGQLVSMFGSGLTGFALGVWVYQRTGSVTQFALISAIIVLPSIVLAPMAGAIIDRYDRRLIMLVSDACAGLCTLALALLLWGDRLEIWHVYLATALMAVTQTFQSPAYQASAVMLTPKKHLGRVSGMMQLGDGLAQLAAPVVAGLIVTRFGLGSVLAIDCASFLFAVLTQLVVRIPRPEVSAEGAAMAREPLLKQAAFGWTFIQARKGLLGLLVFFSLTNMVFSFVQTLITPMVLSFTDAATLGTILSAAGVGLMIGGVVSSIWGGPARRVRGVLVFTALQALVLFLAGFQPSALLVAVGAFLYMLNDPLAFTGSQVIWLTKVPRDIQGRVLAIRRMVVRSCVLVAYLISGPIADGVLEPLMAVNGPLAPSVGAVLGVGPGRGIGFFFVILGAVLVLMVIGASLYGPLQRVEKELPDAVPDTPAPVPSAASSNTAVA